MKITYWYAECLDDSDAYAVRAKTKKAALAEVKERDWRRAENPNADPVFGPVVKVTTEYADAFDLVQMLLGESGGCDESEATTEYEEKRTS